MVNAPTENALMDAILDEKACRSSAANPASTLDVRHLTGNL